ncbi:FMN-binding negative transcriptional regulator [Streptomyces sp. NPDC008125]|uniref:FMN-binding negative transcriptional regulator n=1 Tax=Streptomyces sp. NPDC008125 TaxID=3364811 RepID=UPI0036E71BCE
MFIQPWDAALDDAEWRTWIADGHDFGILSVNGMLGHALSTVPTHFTVDGTALLIHLARPNPVWKMIEADPNVTFTITGDYAFIPGPWRAEHDVPPTDGVPTSYYAAVQFTCQATAVDEPEAKAELLRRQMAHFQSDGDHAPIERDQPPYGRMLPGIRGLRLDVTEVRATFTYDDPKPAGQRTDTARRLAERGTALDALTAAQQLRRLDRIGTWKP